MEGEYRGREGLPCFAFCSPHQNVQQGSINFSASIARGDLTWNLKDCKSASLLCVLTQGRGGRPILSGSPRVVPTVYPFLEAGFVVNLCLCGISPWELDIFGSMAVVLYISICICPARVLVDTVLDMAKGAFAKVKGYKLSLSSSPVIVFEILK